MISVKITDIKAFMSKLLVKDTFDNLCVLEITISTYNTFNINGQLCTDFFSKEELSALENTRYSKWKDLRSICYELIKGNKTPTFMKIIYTLPDTMIQSFIADNSLPYSINDINGLFINFKYSNKELTCTSASSLNIFTLDKSLDNSFDSFLRAYLNTLEINYEE